MNLMDYAKRTECLGQEDGQTSVEYVAVTAMALLIAITIAWALLGTSLESSLTSLFARFEDFIANTVSF